MALTAYLVADKLTNPAAHKIGIVQMEKLVYDFKGMKEATRSYALKTERWNTENDSLENKLKQLYQQLRIDSLQKNTAALKKDVQLFIAFKRSYTEYAQQLQETAAKEDKQMTLGVINQVNDYMQRYAKQYNYDVILCNSDQQSVGYAKEHIDITGQVLDFANRQYEGLK